jgi:lysophospholipase L1-like esterase
VNSSKPGNKNTLKIFLLVLFLSALVYSQPKSVKPDTLRFKTNPNYSLQLELYDVYKPRQSDIVMFGNSLTHGGVWNELLGRQNVIEMGITSDVLRGYFARLNYVFRYRPKIVFIMGGLNDIYNWTPVEDIFSVYIRIIKELKAKNIIPVIQSTTYSARNYAKDWGGTPETNGGRNREADKLNKLLSDYAKSNKIDFIDLIPAISRGGYLRDELTWDGLHFRAEAYRIWAREVDKILQKYKL